MRNRLVFALLATTLVLAGCDGDGPTGAQVAQPRAQLAPIDEGGDGGGGGGGDGGGGGGGTYTPPPTVQYRITPTLAVGNGVYEARTRFERLVNGSWQRHDTSDVAVACYVSSFPGGSSYLRDSEREYNASQVTITFDVVFASGLPPYIDCYHSANNGAYTAVTRSYTTP
jgi:hypothetical protein